MYRNKKDVDKHVEGLLFKLSPKDFKTRAYSIARLYFEVGDYGSCQKYVEQYLTEKSNNAAAHRLLGQAFQKLGEKEKALAQYKTSLDIDPTQASTILDVCELLANDDVSIETGRATYWCEKAEAMFPNHPVTFRLRERLMTIANPNPEAVIDLLKTELKTRPKDAVLHARLLKHLLITNNIKEAFEHSCNIEFDKKIFSNNYGWYESLSEIIKYNPSSLTSNNWLYQLLLLTVKERLCVLSLSEISQSYSRSLVESVDLLFSYDQALQSVAASGPTPGFVEFHNSLLLHHRGQLAFHLATYLLKKSKKGQLHWKDAREYSAPLMLIAWQTIPLNFKVNWLTHAPEKQQNAAQRWYIEGSFRCSQSGHFLLSSMQDKSQMFLDQVSQFCTGIHWKDKLYGIIFSTPEQIASKNSSCLASNSFCVPSLRLPRIAEVQAYDDNAQREYPNSLHHFVWILLNYKQFSEFQCTIFDMLPSSSKVGYGPETLNKMDVLSFLFSATLTTQKQKYSVSSCVSNNVPNVLPANITDFLCTLPQTKWWDCAYKLSQNELGGEYTDIRSTLSRGIEVLRCIDNHGLDPELLCTLGRIFNERAKITNILEEKTNLESRAHLYYTSAIPILEKLKAKIILKVPEKRLFDYTQRELSPKEINVLLEESKLQIALSHLNEGEYEKVINLLSNMKSAEAYYHLSETYKRTALEEINLSKNVTNYSKYAFLLDKAKTFAHKALDKARKSEGIKNKCLNTEIQNLIEEVDSCFTKYDIDSSTQINDESSDEYASVSEVRPMRSKLNNYQNLSSTPKQTKHSVNTSVAYRTAIDAQVFETNQVDQQFLERIEKQIKNLQKRDTTINDFMDQTRDWFEENRSLSNQIISTIHTNIKHTTDQFKLLKMSVDEVKTQIDECSNESQDVADLKKQVAELKKEINKIKLAKTSNDVDESELYSLEDDFRGNDTAPNFGAQLPFAAPTVIPPFAQRFMPPFSVPSNPYQLYGQNFYNLYNQCSQFAQPPPVPGAPPMFDPTRPQMNYPGVFPTPDQMYFDVAHLVPPTIPTVPTMPTAPTVHCVPNVSSIPTTSIAPPTVSVPISKVSFDSKDIPKSTLPVNVVITSSDPLPTCTTAPAPILSVTIPQKHIKGSPHNYQIPMPSTNDSKIVPPPVFSFATSTKPIVTTTSIFNWNAKSIFASAAETTISSLSASESTTTKTVVDGAFTGASPNSTLNKSRTLSERSNTSADNYDPCPDFKPIIPLPAEVKITTGEEDETIIFSSRAKLFRFVDKQWKERGIGEIKLLKHNVTGKVRVLMRREQIHKICANHIISSEMELKPMKDETKAYVWMANDFAEEIVILEKFCIKFKTSELAKEFYEVFEKSRKEAVSCINTTELKNTVDISKIDSEESITGSTSVEENVTDVKSGKTVIGGFTFSSQPTFKTNLETPTNDTNNLDTTKSKINVFSSLTFNANNSFSFNNSSNLPSNINDQTTKTPDKATTTSNKLNISDTVEDFEPTAEFKPVVPLPALVEQKTGEEDEVILFEHRAKLLRFDVQGKEWKERGLGNIKLLVHRENNQKLRLLMRREQIMKVCCNHSVTKEMVFQKMPNMDKAVTWCAKDYSEGELVSETFCLRFKTSQLCDEFIDAVKAAQIKIGDDVKVAKEEQNAAKQIGDDPDKEKNSTKQTTHTGFGDKFKPKPGSWYCQMCYTNNLESFSKCACCETPNPQGQSNNTDLVKTTFAWGDTAKTTPSFGDSTLTKTTSSWGDKFKPKPGSWECKACLVRNEADKEQCSACNSPKDGALKKTDALNNDAPKFNFFIPKASGFNLNAAEPQPNNLKNESTVQSSIFGTNSAQKKFTFGIPPTVTTNFTTPSNSPNTTDIFKTTTVSFGNENAINYSAKNKETESVTITPVKTPLLQTPNTVTSFGKGSGAFEFSFKPKTPTKGKSPSKSPKEHKGDESDDNDYASDDEGHHIHFSPVIPMPDKIEVVTGEENEEELYCHRAKLYIFNVEWKERGIGNVKILKHKDTGNLRVLMRREQVHKICLNHTLVSDIEYKPKDDKTWLFFVNDFSAGEVVLKHFCLRFKNKEIALQFKEAVDKALKSVSDNKTTDSEVVFVKEIQASNEDKIIAKELQLPENFYTYRNKEPCRGCRGCDIGDDNTETVKDKEVTKDSKINVSKEDAPVTTTITTTVLQSPTNSLYGTPMAADKSANNTLTRTPLSALKSNNSLPDTPSTLNLNVKKDDSIDKENTLTDNANTCVFSFLSDRLQQNQPTPKNNSILATPKLSTITPSTSVFGSAETKSFDMTKSPVGDNESVGVSYSSSIFNFSNPIKGDAQQTKSVFTDMNFVQDNLFNTTSQGSIFGPGAMKNIQSKPSIFGNFGGDAKLNANNVFDTSKIDAKQTFDFVLNERKSTIFDSSKPLDFAVKEIKAMPNTTPATEMASKTSNTAQSIFGEATKLAQPTIKTDSNPEKVLFKGDDSLTFEGLSSSSSGFGIEKKANFQWEGAGQQLFVSSSSTKEADTSTNKDSHLGDISGASATAEEEYDPHYEPIVPLPDKIVVTTGEEDEEKLFGERCKLYRFDEKSRDWKERGIGEIKILYHPQRQSYRLLLRREQVHKAVLNMLIFMDMELLHMKNSDRAWTWAGCNYAEGVGEQETLAVRFKTVALAESFYDKVVMCVRKLQAAAADAIRVEKEQAVVPNIAPLRLPKNHEGDARFDVNTSVTLTSTESAKEEAGVSKESDNKENGVTEDRRDSSEVRQVHFEEPEDDEDPDQVDYGEEEEYDYEHGDDYYGEEEEAAYYPCKAFVKQSDSEEHYEQTRVQVCFDAQLSTPKILVTDIDTGEILVDMLIHTDTEFQMTGDTCSWSGSDYTTISAEKKVTITFPDCDSAMEFYDNCETSKASTHPSTDQEWET